MVVNGKTQYVWTVATKQGVAYFVVSPSRGRATVYTYFPELDIDGNDDQNKEKGGGPVVTDGYPVYSKMPNRQVLLGSHTTRI